MTRDLDLIRAILSELEARPRHLPVFAHDIKLPDRSTEEITYHCELLADQGYILGEDSSNLTARDFLVQRLTASGHDYLDAVRSDTIWRKVKARLAERGVSAPLDVVQRLAMQYLESTLFGSG